MSPLFSLVFAVEKSKIFCSGRHHLMLLGREEQVEKQVVKCICVRVNTVSKTYLSGIITEIDLKKHHIK